MKLFTSVRSISSSLMLFVIVAGLQACGGGGGGGAATNNAPTASNVSITDDNGNLAVVGDTLTGSYSYADVESDAEGTSTFRWLRDGVAITGETSLSYTLVVADTGLSITFEVTPVAATGATTGSSVTSSGITAGNNAPTASNVSISDDNGGSVVVGDALTGGYIFTDGDGDLEGSSTFRWLRDGTAISGAIALNYTLVPADSGLSITFEVTPVAATGSTTGSAVTSSGIAVVNTAPAVSNVTITDGNGGTALIGDNLTGGYSYNDADGDLQGSSTFRWLRNGSAISGATSSIYTLVAADSGLTITFEVTPVAATGIATGSAVTSGAVTTGNNAPTATGASITDTNGGSAVVGDNLTGSYSYTDAEGDAEGTSAFRWLHDGSVISGATAPSYTLVAADSGLPITFEVTPVAVTGTATGTAVTSNGITVANSAPTASSVTFTDDNAGNVLVGVTLAGSYSYNDVDGDLEGTSTFFWLRNGVVISGVTTSSYTLVVVDLDAAITFAVTPVAATGITTGSTATSSSILVMNSAPTANSVIITDTNGGSAVVGDSLTGSYSYNDVDEDSEGASTFRWLRDGVAISGATTSSYTLIAADSGLPITFEVTPVAVTGTAIGSAVISSSGITVLNSAPTASNVSITDVNGGDALVGEQLNGSFTYADVDSDSLGISTYRWLRDGVAISGATALSYSMVVADIGSIIIFEVTPVASSGVLTGSPVTSSGITVVNAAPTANSVTITDDNAGNAEVGDSLTGSYSYNDEDGDLEGISTFRWLRDGSAISGATASSYTLVAVDSGLSITFEVTPVAATGTAIGNAVTSSGIAVANSAPTAGSIAITDDNGGIALVGDSLTGSYSYNDVDGDSEGASTYRWLRDGVAISGATASTYTLVIADSGLSISFEVTPVAATGATTGSAVTSASITVIANYAPTASNVTITDNNGGSALTGDTLTGTYAFADADGDLEGASTFRWLRNGTAISLATSSTYTLVLADFASSVTFEVTPVALTGITTGVAVVSTNTILPGNTPPTASSVTVTDDNGGSAVVGDALSGGYIYADTEDDFEATSTFRWLRNDTAISSATLETYTLVAADSGQAIRFEITPVAATGTTVGNAAVSSGITVNSAPAISGVVVTDIGGGDALLGDFLTANYSYADVDGDQQGDSTYRWLRNGVAIDGATNFNYTLTMSDVPAQIVFEVTPVALTGELIGEPVTSSVLATGSAPKVSGVARYLDINNNSVIDTDDEIVIPFDQDIVVNVVAASDFNLPVAGDSFGVGSSVVAGPASNEVTVTLGTLAHLKTRQDFSGAATTANSASGIDIATAMAANAIESLSGYDATKSTAIDIMPAYVDSLQLLGSLDSKFVVTGDVNGDGHLDMVVANGGTQGNMIYLNDGTGSFTATAQSLGASDSYSVALGDVDGDGGLDMVVANYAEPDRVYINDGSGTFTDSGQELGMGNSRWVVLGDLNRDGSLDMVVANYNQGNTVYLNDGDGSFTATQSLGAESSSTSIALGDVDNDGTLDVVVGNYAAGNRVYTNDGNGSFTDSTQSLGSYYSYSVALGDVNGDGSLDMVVGNSNLQRNRIYFNDGSGGFTDSGQTLGSSFSVAVALGDMDNDGDLDMVVANATSANLNFTNDGDGNFTNSGQSLGTSGRGVALGDVDSDGDLDVVVANFNVGNRVYFGSLSATWGTVDYVDSNQSLGSASSQSVALGDVDSDGDLDMVVANSWFAANRVYTNNGGNFTVTTQELGANDSISVALGDIDNNGTLDMVVANSSANLAYTNDGTGAFTVTAQSLGTSNSRSIALGDVNGDGSLDMVVANLSQGNLIYTNDGSGAFTVTAQSLGTNSSRDVALGDINGDGSLDMVVANYGQGNRIYTNDGSGAFTDSGQSLGTNDSTALTLGDVDGDGALDIVVTNSTGQGNRVYINDGSGNFTDSAQSLGTNASLSAVLGDVDGDGDLDMVVANQGQANVIYSNDGSGTFTDSGQSLGTNDSFSIAIGDVDGDGDLDMAVGNNNQGNRIYLNQ